MLDLAFSCRIALSYVYLRTNHRGEKKSPDNWKGKVLSLSSFVVMLILGPR